MPPKDQLTPEQAEEMRQKLAEFDNARIEKAKADAAVAVQPVREIAESDQIKWLIEKCTAAREQLIRHDQLSSLLKNIVDTAGLLGQFADQAERQIIAEAGSLKAASPK